MVWYKIDSGSGRLWVVLFRELERLVDRWMSSKNRPSPLKGFTASPTKGNAT